MSNPRVLVIDDDEGLLQAIPSTFEIRLPQVAVDTCVSAVSALEQIRDTDYHAIICDLNMPVMNGLTLLGEMKTVRPWTPMLLMTGNDNDELIQQAAKAGAYDFIRKPVNRDMLVLSVKRALEAHQWRAKQEIKNTIVCIQGLPLSVSVERVRNWMAPFGKLVGVRLLVTFSNDQSATYAYIEFATPLEAQHARRNVERAPFGEKTDLSLR